jgi:PRC-barrel domain
MAPLKKAMNLGCSFGVSIDDTQEDAVEGRMNCFVRVVAIIGILLFVLAETSAHAADWRFSQATAQPAQSAEDQSVPAATTEQPAPPTQQPPPESAHKDAAHENAEDGTPATVIDDRDAEGILGKSVRSAANEDMGRVVDVIVKRTGEVRAAVIDFGGFLGVGSRTIAVDWSALRFPKSGPMDHIILELTRDQVRLAPEYKPGEPLVVLGQGDVHPHPETPAPEH